MKRFVLILCMLLLFLGIKSPQVKGLSNIDTVGCVVSMTPSQGNVGETVTIIASNVPGKAEIWFGAEPPLMASVASVKTLSNTNLAFTFCVPAIKAGTYRVYLDPLIKPIHMIPAGSFIVLGAKEKTDAPGDPTIGSPIGGRPNQPSQPNPRVGQPGATTAPKIDLDLDLPLEKPVFGQVAKAPPPPLPPVDPVDVVPPPSIYGHDLKSENGTIMYVIDISGSMGWDQMQYITADGKTAVGCRLDRAKAELIRSITSLPKNFKFNVDAFDCSVNCWKFQLELATDSNKSQAIAWVTGLQPQGATGTGPAMAMALQIRACKLYVLLTDGAPNCGAGDQQGDAQCMEAHRRMISGNNAQRAIINVFGINCTGEFKVFCSNVASDSGGSYTDIK